MVVTVTDPVRAPNDLTGQQVGGSYRLIRIIGEGGMGQVWLARASDLDNREAAVKVLSRDAASQPEYLRRFKEPHCSPTIRSRSCAIAFSS